MLYPKLREISWGILTSGPRIESGDFLRDSPAGRSDSSDTCSGLSKNIRWRNLCIVSPCHSIMYHNLYVYELEYVEWGVFYEAQLGAVRT